MTKLLRVATIFIPWIIWLVACLLPAYRVDEGVVVNGWDCFIYGFGAVISFDGWPWVLAWLANITMLVATITYLVISNRRVSQITACVGAAISLLVFRFNFGDDGTGLQIGAFAWIFANLLLYFIVLRDRS